MPYPFEQLYLSQPVPKLTDLLRMQCELMYYMNMSLSDIESCNRAELDWTYEWLIGQKKSEADQIEKSLRN